MCKYGVMGISFRPLQTAPPARSPMDAATIAKIGLAASILGAVASWIGEPAIVIAAIGLAVSLFALYRIRGGLGNRLAVVGAALGVLGIVLGILFQTQLWGPHGRLSDPEIVDQYLPTVTTQ